MYRITPHVGLPATPFSLRGKTALVTGGSRGIGGAVVRLLREAGGTAIALARQNADINCDVASEQQVRESVLEAHRALGVIDLVVNCAGYIWPATVLELSLKNWQQHLAVNLTGPFLVSREAIPWMGTDGVIVNVASSAAHQGKAGWSAYAASKAALVSFTESTAAEGNVRAYCVSPGRTDTEMRNALFPDEDRKTLLDPEDVARLILFCSSAQNRFATGQTFRISR